jgi:hypothetical protein
MTADEIHKSGTVFGMAQAQAWHALATAHYHSATGGGFSWRDQVAAFDAALDTVQDTLSDDDACDLFLAQAKLAFWGSNADARTQAQWREVSRAAYAALVSKERDAA